jgi:glutaredoxin
MNVILYTIGCPKCKVLEAKLTKAAIDFKTVTNEEIIGDICNKNGISGLPVLQVDDKIYNFTSAVKWVGEQN